MVYFTIAGGEIVPEIEMSSSETILDLKEKIRKELEVEVDRQNLWYNNRMLRDHELIADHGFRGNVRLMLNVTPLSPDYKLHVMVKHPGSDGFVRVRETDKVRHLRGKVERCWGVPPRRFTLSRLNVEMKDNFPLSAYYINEASEVELKIIIEPR
ncbi:hypothetical protein RJT34_24375 [Clitoria ternatea]|uniref:Ubiquitin-like domain-containing protein n=1 Tax=Clitoria ternatea TaxID=43366 RepID=A0AAN9FMS4_CLITE